jgi:thiosulfate/3-mercaptopyruvate sulfurtransferase
MLRGTGHPAALLDGGLAAWTGPLEPGATSRPPALFRARPWPPERLATIDEVARAAGAGRRLVLLDARAPERYRGETEPVDPRPGHIPGARNLPFAGNLDPVTGRHLPARELRARYEAAGAGEGAGVVVYCGSGVTACHDLLALEAAGLGPGRLYPGSWSQWSSDRARPAATGEDP